MSMHPDLEWLAKNAGEWVSHKNLSMVRRSTVGPEFYDPDRFARADGYTKSQWLQARKDLGLIMSDAEEELPAKEWAGSITDSEEDVDMVSHPPHYTQGGIECIDAIRAALTPEEFRGYCKGNALKYVWRERHKGGDESMRKADWYINKITKSGE